MGGNKGVDLAALLVSDGSSSSSEEEPPKKKKNKKKHAKAKKSKKSKKKIKISSDDSDLSEKKSRNQSKYGTKGRNKSYSPDSERDTEVSSKFKNTKTQKFETRKRKSDECDSETEYKRKKSDLSRKISRGVLSSDDDGNRTNDRKRSPQNYKKLPSRKNYSPVSNTRMSYDKRRRSPDSEIRTISPDRKRYDTETYWNTKKTGLSEQERAARLAEMAAAGAEREVQRERKVAQQRAADAKETEEPRRPRTGRNEARALPNSLESRIHSNRHYIQRDKRHMNENFARR